MSADLWGKGRPSPSNFLPANHKTFLTFIYYPVLNKRASGG